MNLQTSISAQVWAAVQAAYEAGNYTASILDSIHYLSDLIRNKSGLDSDGNALIGAAFGGANPIIKVNSLQTESERDEQRGIEQLLRGIYTAIRNPRSHDKRSDSAEQADVIIAFVDYVASFVDKSRSPFDLEQIVERVFDKHFVPSEAYANLLVQRIPQRKKLEVVLEVFKRRTEGNWKANRFFVEAVLRTITTEEQAEFWDVVSEALEHAYTDADYRSAIQVAEKYWDRLSEIARLRTENRLIDSIREGEYDEDRRMCPKGSLGTWATKLAPKFTLQNGLIDACVSRLSSPSGPARQYVLQYFIDVLRELSPSPPLSLEMTLSRRLLEHDKAVYDRLWFCSDEFAEESEGDAWVTVLKPYYDRFTPGPESPTEITDEDIPF